MFPTRRITTSGGDKFRDEFSLSFDGGNDFVNCGDSSDWNFSNGSASIFSVSVWFKSADGTPSANDTLISKYDTGTNKREWRISTDSNKRIIVYVSSNGSDASSAYIPYVVDNTNWHNVVFVYNGSDATADSRVILYVDGINYATVVGSTLPAILNESDRALTIGAYTSSGSSHAEWHGNISEAAIYNKALSASEVKTLYNGREPYNHKEGVCSSNLKAWWRMGDGSSNNRKFLYVENSASSAGSNIITSSTFDSDEDGWVEEPGGSNSVSRVTDIASHSGSAGVLKAKCTNASSQYFAGTSAITSGMESGKIYVAEAYVYIPSSWSGTQNIYINAEGSFGETGQSLGRIENNVAVASIKDQWQHIFTTFLCGEDSGSGNFYLRAIATDNLEVDDFIYLDDFKLTEIDKPNSGIVLKTTQSAFEGDTP